MGQLKLKPFGVERSGTEKGFNFRRVPKASLAAAVPDFFCRAFA